MKEFSFKTRNANLQKLKNEKFDLLIIGGGVTGAGVARDAALRGLKVALVEANDFSVGTSSRSSKLVHGGIRYLENFEFHLVFEALSERSKLLKLAPHLVHPLRFMIPIFENSRVGLFKMGLGMMLYDALALFRTPKMHEKLNKKKTLERMPVVRGNDLVGSCIYSDAYMDDDRLVHETLRSANEAGACIVNYTQVTGSVFKSNKISALNVKDSLHGQSFSIECTHVVSSVGPWTDLVGEKLVSNWKSILRPTKGIHLTLPKTRLNLSSAVVMGAQESSRIVFAIPRHEMTIIGTTDTDFKGDPTNAEATFEDVEYLLKITNEYFPDAKLTYKDVISSYVGVRPLVKDESGSEGKTSREHVILSDDRGFTFVAGGKYTTYRLMAEQIVDRVLANGLSHKKSTLKKCQTTEALNKFVTMQKFEEAQKSAQGEIQQKLAFRYGAEYSEIINNFGSKKSYWELEAYQAIRNTMCVELVDFYTRRVPLMLSNVDHGMSFVNEISLVFKNELNWSDAEVSNQQAKLKSYIENELRWIKKFKP
ncbi:MAG: glycerol-3-phosphate dehydrogenase/oxidase [Pseudobdellovibrio sp.]